MSRARNSLQIHRPGPPGACGADAGVMGLGASRHLSTDRWYEEEPPPLKCGIMTALEKVSELEEVPMAIVGGLDVHRQQITFDYVDTETGEIRRGEIRPATRDRLRSWLGRFPGQEAAFALEATTGWRFVTDELRRVGIQAHLAEPADTRALRGPKRRAKTDREDARHLRAAGPGPSPGVLDPTGGDSGAPHASPVAPRSRERADGLAAAHSCPALPPWAASHLGALGRRPHPVE